MRLIVVLGLAVALGSAVAHAQPIKDAPTAAPKQDAAAAHFRLGVDFYRAGDYAAARVEFEAAFGLSGQADLLHNLSLTAEKLGRYREAVDYEQRFLSTAAALTNDETDQARGRLLRLRDLDRRAGTAPEPSRSPSKPQARHEGGWRPPQAAIGLLAGGGAALVAGFACGGAALATAAQLGDGTAYTLREIDGITGRGQALNAAAITLDAIGGLSVLGGGAWILGAWVARRPAPVR